jgi:hypothetical protein
MEGGNMPEASRIAEFRFYEELNDHLSPPRRKRTFTVAFTGRPQIGELIAILGVPPAEVDLVLVDGASCGFERRLSGGERVAVYPVFERFNISPLARLPGRPLAPRLRR